MELDPSNELKEESQYVGQVNSNGEKHGIGRNCVKDWGIFEGQWNQDRANGFGRAINLDDLSVFEGYFEDGFEHGEGIMKFAGG